MNLPSEVTQKGEVMSAAVRKLARLPSLLAGVKKFSDPGVAVMSPT